MLKKRPMAIGLVGLIQLAAAAGGGEVLTAVKAPERLAFGSPGTAPRQSTAAKRRRRIKIATIGASTPTVAPDTAPAEVVRLMIDHWKDRFAQVLPDRPDLIVVPEVCDRPLGLTDRRLFEYYEVRGNRIRGFFADVARENRSYVVYSAVRKLADGSWRNSNLLLNRKGEIAGQYDKNHPTIGELEQGILPGDTAPVIECDFGRVALAICFDLNFDALRLQYARARPDLIVFSSMYHGGLMQAYWAYSCRSHFVGAISRSCPSEIRNPLGNVIATNTNYFDFAVASVNLDCALVHLDYNWNRLRALKDKYRSKVTMTDPGYLGSVLVASEHESIDVEQMLAEFEIERLDDYFHRARQQHKVFRRQQGGAAAGPP